MGWTLWICVDDLCHPASLGYFPPLFLLSFFSQFCLGSSVLFGSVCVEVKLHKPHMGSSVEAWTERLIKGGLYFQLLLHKAGWRDVT